MTVTAPTGTGYTLGAIGEKQVRFGGGLWLDGYDYVTGQHWSKISNHLQRTAPNDLDSAISVDVDLAPREDRVIRLCSRGTRHCGRARRTTFSPACIRRNGAAR